MKYLIETMLPAIADNVFRGSNLPFYALALIATIGTVRSGIHLFAPDGGAGSIAGMDLAVADAEGIILP